MFFFPVNIKSAREPHFFELLHGHFFAFTGTLGDLFTGTFFLVRGQNLGKCSRGLLAIHGHFFEKSTKNSKF